MAIQCTANKLSSVSDHSGSLGALTTRRAGRVVILLPLPLTEAVLLRSLWHGRIYTVNWLRKLTQNDWISCSIINLVHVPNMTSVKSLDHNEGSGRRELSDTGWGC